MAFCAGQIKAIHPTVLDGCSGFIKTAIAAKDRQLSTKTINALFCSV